MLFRRKKLESSGWSWLVVVVVLINVACASQSSSSSSLSTLDDSSLFKDRQCAWLYQENPNDCNSYFQCVHGESIKVRCPRELVWNSEGSFCDWKYRTACKVKATTQKRKQATSSKYSTSKIFIFPTKIFGTAGGSCSTGYASDSTDCSKYYLCNHGTFMGPLSCNPGLHWDPVLNVCNWPRDVQCSANSDLPPPAPLPPAAAPLPPAAPQESEPEIFFPDAVPVPPSTTPPPTTTPRPPTPRPTSASTPRPTTKPSGSSQTQYPILVGPPPYAESRNFKIICYYSSWAHYRQGDGKYGPSDIDYTKCTHIIYAFAQLNPFTFKLEMQDPWVDGKDGLDHYGKVTALRAKGIKVLIAVGGWVDSGYSKWSLLFKDPYKMQVFIDSTIPFLLENDFDGLDLDYEYPGCPQANCNFDSDFEKQAFVTLVRGLKAKFGSTYLLTAAVSCNEVIMKEAYDIPTLSRYLDWMNVMSYDIHGPWEKITGHISPLYPQHSSDLEHLNVYYAIQKYIEFKAPPEKICMGIPFHGQTFQLADMTENALGSRASGPGKAGPSTKQKGMLAHHEICSMKSADNWTTVHDEKARFGPYSHFEDQWVSYDDRRIIDKKCDVIKELNLGGAMIWSLDLDDFRGACGSTRYPLLTVINGALRTAKRRVSHRKTVPSLYHGRRY